MLSPSPVFEGSVWLQLYMHSYKVSVRALCARGTPIGGGKIEFLLVFSTKPVRLIRLTTGRHEFWK